MTHKLLTQKLWIEGKKKKLTPIHPFASIYEPKYTVILFYTGRFQFWVVHFKTRKEMHTYILGAFQP